MTGSGLGNELVIKLIHELMKSNSLSLLLLAISGVAVASPIAGVDFSDELGGNTDVPEDLNLDDAITVSTWSFPGATGGVIQGDANANAGRASAPFAKFDGPIGDGVAPSVGDAPPADGIHTFSITIGDEAVNLTEISFVHSKATGSGNLRWIAFRTSLDDTLIYSELGPARPNVREVNLVLNDPKYENLANQTVDFFWYCGGEGSGDMDIDSIVIEGLSTSDSDSDGMPDAFEQIIIDADPDDVITTIADVLPGDDFDNDLSTNLDEFLRGTLAEDPDTDGDNLLDGVETNDGTFDDLASDTGTDPLDDDSDGDGLNDGVETNDGSFDDLATDTGSNPLEMDSDSDLMPDGFEAGNGLDPNLDDAAGDLDADQSTNLEEFDNGTFPNDNDSDDDGVLDGPESNSGIFVDSSDTGSDPLNPDTDGDGLLDGVESGSGNFVDTDDTGTDPNNENTDGDNFRDSAEVLIHGTDPNQANSAPSSTTTVLFIGGNAEGTAGADEVAVALLEDKFGLDKVTVDVAANIAAGSEEAFDLLVISSTPGSGDIRGKFIDSPVPLINWEEAVVDNGGGEFGASTVILSKSNETTRMVLGDHPIAGGLPETITLYNEGSGGESTSTPMLFEGLTAVGTAVDGTSTAGAGIGLDVTGNAMLIAIEAGDAVDPGSGTLDGVAPARRVMMPFTDNTLATLSADGLQLFSNAMDWAIGKPGSPVGLRVVDFTVDASTPGNRVATLSFTSTEGQEYTILTSTDLADFTINNAAELTTVTGQAGTTTLQIDFNANFIPLTDEKRFFVVREGGEQ
jgi:hypothetical protein